MRSMPNMISGASGQVSASNTTSHDGAEFLDTVEKLRPLD
jgi:hypothetical protein